ncbi:MAG: hypothetical protein JO103_03490, partial [Candidatus Eremiobacteraeota bacterium]|nr:hypothetical protein [Candidatus Eremiobacteraeota bacterium]
MRTHSFVTSRALAPCLLAGALASCGGGAAGTRATMLPATPVTPTTTAQNVAFRIVIPTPSASAHGRRPAYVSAATKSAKVTVTPGNVALTVDCTTVCSGTIAAPTGADTFSIALYAQSGGTGNVLSEGTTTQTIVANQPNIVSVTFDAVVQSFTLALANTKLAAGSAGSDTLTLRALDPAGNTIVGPGRYVDANDNPLTVTLGKSDDTNNGAGSGTTTLATTTITGPSSSAVTVSYDGGALRASTYSAAVTGGAAYTVAPVTLSMTPTMIAEYPVGVGGGRPDSLAAGKDGALYYTASNLDGVGRMTLGGAVTMFPLTNDEPAAIALGPDDNFYFTTFAETIGKLHDGGGATQDGLASFTGGFPGGITVLANGNIWWADTNGKIDNATIANPSNVHSYPLPNAADFPTTIVLGPDGNLWF